MKLTFLGQGGAWLDLESGLSIAIDPYLSDSICRNKGERFRRQVPVSDEWIKRVPDILLLTHDHGDHMDMETISPWLDMPSRKQVMGPHPVFAALYERWPAKHNIMVAREGVSASLGGARVSVVPASHETADAVGYMVEAEDKCLYFSGDTLYTDSIPAFFAGRHIDLMLVCINGFGNNMNAVDAARLAAALRPVHTIPVHWDMFSSYGADPTTFIAALEPSLSAEIIPAYTSIIL